MPLAAIVANQDVNGNAFCSSKQYVCIEFGLALVERTVNISRFRNFKKLLEISENSLFPNST